MSGFGRRSRRAFRRFERENFTWFDGGHYTFVNADGVKRVPATLAAAQGIEAGTAATVEQGAVHESPVANGDAPETSLGGSSDDR